MRGTDGAGASTVDHPSRWRERPPVRPRWGVVALGGCALVLAVMQGLESMWLLAGGALLGTFTDPPQMEDATYAPLFESTTDAVAVVAFGEDGPLIYRANERYAETFGYEQTELPGTNLWNVVTLSSQHRDGVREFRERAQRGEAFETRLVGRTAHGERPFVARVVPMDERSGTAYAFLVLTDIEWSDYLDEQTNAKLTELISMVTRMTNAASHGQVYDLTVESLLDTFEYDAITLYLDGDPVRQEGIEQPVCPTDLDDAVTTGELQVATAVEHAGGGETWSRVVTVPIDARGALQVARKERRPFERTTASAVGLVGAHLEETLAKLDREERLTREREHLEFLHRLLRHHLLNGLNLVQARMELLEDDVEPPAEEHHQTVRRRVTEMIDRIQTIRAFSRVLTKPGEHDPEPVELEPILDEQVGAMREIYQSVDIDVENVPDATVGADQLLNEVVDNLLTNAVQHNDAANPVIRVRCVTHGDDVQIRIADNGPGVDDERKSRIFEKGVSTIDSADHGLGLYLVQEVLDAYDGDIWVEDSELGGAEFVMCLPASDQ